MLCYTIIYCTILYYYILYRSVYDPSYTFGLYHHYVYTHHPSSNPTSTFTDGSLQRHILPSPPISELKIALSNSYNVISSANFLTTFPLDNLLSIVFIICYRLS